MAPHVRLDLTDNAARAARVYRTMEDKQHFLGMLPVRAKRIAIKSTRALARAKICLCMMSII